MNEINPYNPCFKCTVRSAECHCSCPGYKEYRAKIDAFHQQQFNNIVYAEYIFGSRNHKRHLNHRKTKITYHSD